MTLKQKQNKAISEYFGWTEISLVQMPVYTDRCTGLPSYHVEVMRGKPPWVEWGKLDIPNYVDNLQEMYNVEESLTEEQWTVYLDHLGAIGGPDGARLLEYVHKTSAQKAEAFLKTIGWEDEQT